MGTCELITFPITWLCTREFTPFPNMWTCDFVSSPIKWVSVTSFQPSPNHMCLRDFIVFIPFPTTRKSHPIPMCTFNSISFSIICVRLILFHSQSHEAVQWLNHWITFRLNEVPLQFGLRLGWFRDRVNRFGTLIQHFKPCLTSEVAGSILCKVLSTNSFEKSITWTLCWSHGRCPGTPVSSHKEAVWVG